jgi:hypothetical protein
VSKIAKHLARFARVREASSVDDAPPISIWEDDYRAALAEAWDAAIASLEYPDGSPVEIVSNANPYRGDS